MDVHDCGRADKKRPLEPGMVITVEPGLYIPHTRANVDRDWWGTAVRCVIVCMACIASHWSNVILCFPLNGH